MNDSHSQNIKWKRGFFTIAAGQTVSLVGSSAVQFALIWWLARETGSPVMLSVAGLFAFLPQLILGPFVGVWVDRLRRKTVIICADLFIGLVAFIFSLFFFFGSPPYWSACVVLGIRSIGNVFHTPAIQAAIPMLVPSEELVRANGWSQFMQSGAFMLGPVLGAGMYAALPMSIILLSDLVGAIVASATVAAVAIPDPPRPCGNNTRFLEEIKVGAIAFSQDRNLLRVTLTAMIIMIFYSPMASLYPLMISDHFGASEWHASLVQICYSGGMMLCSFLLGRYGKIKNKFKVVYFGLFGLGATALVCGVLPKSMSCFWLFAVACACMSASGTLYNIPYIAYMQENIPPELLGRAFSLMSSIMAVTMPVGLLIAGPFAEWKGVSLWFLIAGIAIIIITAVSAFVVLRKKTS